MKKLLITGGTGFFGKNLLHFLKKKLKDHKIYFTGRSIERCRQTKLDVGLDFFPCDIANYKSVVDCISKIQPTTIVHLAATKYVDLAEKYPFECIDTNVNGTINLIRAGQQFNLKNFIAISTDKSAPPYTNIYSVTKYLMEKSLMLENQISSLNISCIRFGNLPWSTGSIFPIWEEMSKKNKIVKSTGPEMTRFFYKVSDACQLVELIAKNPKSFSGKVIIPDMKSVKIKDLLKVWCKNYSVKWKKVKKRQGDKDYESILSENEYCKINLKNTRIGKLYLLDILKDGKKKNINSINTKKFSSKEIEEFILDKPKFL